MTLALEFRAYRTAFVQPLQTAHGFWAEREGVIVRLTHESGRTALGEIAPLPWFGTESLEQALVLCESLGSSLDAGTIAGIPDALPCCRFAFGSALEALNDNPEPDASRCSAVACLLPAGFAGIDAAKEAVLRGFTRLKWKVGVAEEDSEIRLLRKLVEGLPAGVLLRLDANGAWDRDTAQQWVDACDGLPIEFIEQPFQRGDDAALLEFGTEHPGLFALDESVTPPGELWRWLECGWPGVVIVKPSLAGDPGKLRQLLLESKADVVFSTALETSIGWHAALRFALSCPGSDRALGFGAGRSFMDSLRNPPDASPTLMPMNAPPHKDPWTHPAH